MKKKIGVVSLGCPKNLVDSEIMLGILKEDFEITNDETDADIIIVNTCGFIESAKQESINTILEMAEHKKGKCSRLIVTGCLAERYRNQIIEQIPEVDAVVGTGSYGEIREIIEKAYKGEKPVQYGKLNEIDYLKKHRILSTQKGYAYLKIAEGCDNCCTYCVIPSLRGRYRSRSMDELIREAEALSESGVKEIILIAQDTTRYGTDIYGEHKIVELIQKISKIDGIEWIRLLYCYPEVVDDRLIDEIANNEKVCKYIDIPIQHISDSILKRMGRRGTGSDIKNLIRKLRNRIPDITIRTTLIVGFPGETEEDFSELYDFVKEYRFERLGVFTYSREEGTPAARMKPQINKKIKEKRLDSLMKLQKNISIECNKKRLNKIYKAIVEGVSDDGLFYCGRTGAEAPDIDGVIYFASEEPLEAGDLVDVRILNVDEYDLIGEVVNEFAQ